MSGYIDRGTNGQSDTGLALRDFLLNGGATAVYNDASDPRLQANLAIAKQYDPNASIANYGGDGGQSYINADWSKLPKIGGVTAVNQGVRDGQSIDGTPLFNLAPTDATNAQAMALHNRGAGGILHSIIDPSKVQQDANFGDVTDQNNIKSFDIPEKKTALDRLGPMVPMLAAAIGTGGLSLASLASGSGNGMANLVSSIVQTLGNGGSFNPLSIAGNVAGMVPGVDGIAPYIDYAKKGMAAYNALNSFNRNPTGSGLTLGNIGLSAFGGANNGG